MSEVHRSAEWAALTRRLRPVFKEQIENGTAICIDCGKPIYPGQTFACGHIVAAAIAPDLALADWNIGPTHHGKSGANCNQRAGGSLGAHKTNAKRRRAEGTEFPKWY